MPEKGVGGGPCPNFWDLFYHVLVHEIGIFLTQKLLIFVCHLVIFCYHYHQNYHHNYHWTQSLS